MFNTFLRRDVNMIMFPTGRLDCTSLRSGRELWIRLCFPSVVVCARVSHLTATGFSANHEITAIFSAKSASLAELNL